MSKNEVTSGKAYTAPKGRPTVHRNAQQQGRHVPSTVQWGLAILAFLIVLGIVFYVFRGFRTVGGGGQHGSPADSSITALVNTVLVNTALLMA